MKKPNEIGKTGACSAIAVLLLAPALIAAQAAAKKPQEKPQVVDMGSYTVSAPPGSGWNIEVDKETGEIAFTKVKQGLLNYMAMQRRGLAVIVKRDILNVSGCRATEDEVIDGIFADYVPNSFPLHAQLEREVIEWDGKKIHSAKCAERSTGMNSDDVLFVYLPPDYVKSRQFFVFEFFFIRPGSHFLKLYNNPGMEPVRAVINSLVIVDPLSALPGPDGELIRAASAGDTEAMRRAIDGGAKLDASLGGTTPLSVAAFQGRREAVDLLLELGAAIDGADDETGSTPLQKAALGLEPVIARLLIERGADIDKKAKDGSTCLMCAAQTGQADLVSALIERGAAVEARDEEGKTPLIRGVEGGSVESARLMIDHGADIDVRSDTGLTALMVALEADNTELANMLLGAGAEVNLKTDEGWTALFAVAYSGRTEIARAMIEKGADVNVTLRRPNWGIDATPLHVAISSGAYDIARMLIEAGADVNARTEIGYTPLMCASAAGQAGTVKLLLEKGADVNAKTDKNLTALKFAKQKKNKEIVRLLQAAGAK